jgi:hypothetical protein
VLRREIALIAVLSACGPPREVTMYCDKSVPFTASPPMPSDVQSLAGATPNGFRIAFVSEAYTEDKLSEFRSDAQTLIDDMKKNPGMIVGRRPDLFTFDLISVASKTTQLKNTDRSDTAFAGCLSFATTGAVGSYLEADRSAAASVVAAAVGDVDAVVVLMNTQDGAESASLAQDAAPGAPPVVLANWPPESELAYAPGSTLDHELGHALVGLEDEYIMISEPYPSTSLAHSGDLFFLFPNVTDDPTGAKWSQLVTGAVPGGALYASGIFHPTTECRMNVALSEFCAVCSHAVDEVLDARATGMDTDGPPRCGIWVSGEPALVQAEAFDLTPPVTVTLTIDGTQADMRTGGRHPGAVAGLTRKGGNIAITAHCTDGSGLAADAQLTFAY